LQKQKRIRRLDSDKETFPRGSVLAGKPELVSRQIKVHKNLAGSGGGRVHTSMHALRCYYYLLAVLLHFVFVWMTHHDLQSTHLPLLTMFIIIRLELPP